MADKEKSLDQLLLENEELKLRLAAKDTLIETFRESENKYAAVYNSMSEGLAIHELMYDNSGKIIDYIIIDVNPAYEQIIGVKKKQVVGRKATDVYKTGMPPYLDIYSKVALTGDAQTFETYFSPMDKHFHVSVFSPEKGKFATVFQDISERKRTEEKLQITLQRFYLMLSRMYSGLLLMTNDGKVEFLNQAFCDFYNLNDAPEKLIGISSDELLRKIIPAFRYPESAELMIREILEKGEPVRNEEFEMQSERTALRNFIPLYIQGVSQGHLWVHVDITDRKLAEEALRESEERFRSTFQNSPDAITITRLNDGKIIEGNNSVYALLGYNNEEVVGKTTMELGIWADSADRNKLLQALSSQGFIQNEDFVLRKKNGTLVPVNLSASLIKINNEQCFISSFIDLTERKKAEEALRNSEERLRVTLTSIGDAVITVDTQGKVTFLNPVAITLTGWKQSEAAGQPVLNVFNLVNEITQVPAEDIVTRVLNEGRVIGLSNHTSLVTKDGRQIPIEDSAAPIKDQLGNVIGVVLVFHDVTEKRRAQEALRESEERFRNLVKNAPTAIYEIDFITRKLTTVNDSLCQLSGYSRDELLSMDSLKLLDDDSKILFLSMIHKSLKGEEPEENVEYKVIAKDGHIIDAVLNFKFTRNKQGIPVRTLVVVHDITLRKQAAEEIRKAGEALRESEQRLKYHLENSPLAVVEWDKEFTIIQWSNEAERLFGIRREEAIGVRIDMLNIIYHEDIPLVEKAISRLTGGKELKIVSQNRNITKTGEILECIWYNSVLLDDKGEMSSVMSLVEDVTLLRQIEKELMESRESYKELVTNARSIILKFDNQACFTFINEFALDFFGYKEEEIIGKSVMIVVPETESTGRDLNEMVDNIVEDPDNYSININENVKKNGEKVWVEWHNKTLFDESGKKTGHIAIGVDITKRKKAEEALKESERKLRSVLDATQESIYMFDKDGMIVMSNTTGIRRLKRKVESEVVMHHISEFMTAELAEKRLLKINEVFNSRIPLSYEDERETTAFQHNLFPLFKDENVMFVVTYSTNITESRNAEAKLKQSEDRFRTIAESLTVIVSITKISDSTVTFLNDPFEKSFGYKKGEILGTRMPDIYYYPDDNKFLVDSLKVKGLVENVEVRVKRKDGTPFWIMTSIRKINYLNEPSYLTASIDISETKKSQEELLRLNRTLDAQSKSSQAMMHNQNELDYINEVCKIIIEDCGHSMVWVGYAQNDKRKSVKPVAYFGFDKGYIDQMNITWDDNERGSGPTGSAIKTGEPSICRNMLTDPCFAPWKDAAAKRGYASSVVLPLKSEGKAFGAISIYSKDSDPFTDSEIDLLTELADDLAYGILFIRLTEYEKEATRAIKENELRLKELIATKDKFFNIIAHDLKNPFTSLLGASELLYDNITKMSAENVKKLAMILNDSAKGGYSILQNLLDWSRSQTGQLKFVPEKVNLKSIIDENIDNLQLQVNNKEINLKSDQSDDLFINADKNMINTVLRNLLSNAVKYTFNNGIIRVMVAQDKDKITLTVKDSGIGISKEKADSLFKLENALSLPGTAKEQGTGLGLKLCKEFTEKMGGRIWVESEVGKGSEFKFTIPIIGVMA